MFLGRSERDAFIPPLAKGAVFHCSHLGQGGCAGYSQVSCGRREECEESRRRALVPVSCRKGASYPATESEIFWYLSREDTLLV